MKFNTERLTVRPFRNEDLDDVFSIYSSEETCRYLLHEAWTHHNKREKFNKKLEQHKLTEEQSLSLAVVSEGRVIGDLSVWYTQMKDTVEIGYTFSQESSGKGLATEALSSLVQNLFLDYKVHRIQATLDARNGASGRLCERIGMRKEAHFIRDYWNKGEWTDSIVYGMLAEDLNRQSI